MIFDTYREQQSEASDKNQDRYEIVTASADNRVYVMYSPDTNSIVQVFRDRFREEEHVFEDYVDIITYDDDEYNVLSPIPKEFQEVPILAMQLV